MRNYVLMAAGVAVLFAGGCACCGHKECPACNPPASGGELTRPAAVAGTAGELKVFPVAPAQMVKKVEEALKAEGLNAVSSQSGVIQTDWKDYPGEMHIARRWQERSRFRVSVIPDVTNPTGASRFEVAEETQRRSNDKANWEEAGRRVERANELAGRIAGKVAR